jgi:hypothetical protein
VSWTEDPTGTDAPEAGVEPLTGLLGLPVTPDTLSPAAWSAAVACCTESPPKLGTCTVGGPVDTVTVTVEPYGAEAPLAGLVEMT